VFVHAAARSGKKHGSSTTLEPAKVKGPETTRLYGINLALVAGIGLNALLLFVVIPVTAEMFAGSYRVGFVDDYDEIANNVASGVGYRLDASMGETMMREPGYPLFLAGVFKIFGYGIDAARVANFLLALATVLLIRRVATKVSDDPAVPVVAALLFLYHPGVLLAEARGGVELLFMFVLLGFALTLHWAVERGLWRHYFIAGMVLGVAVLVRSTPLLLPLFILGFLFLTGRDIAERSRSIANVLVLVLGGATVLSPWIIRNYALVHEFVPTASVRSVAAQEGQYTCEHMTLGDSFQASQADAAEYRNAVARQLGVPFQGRYYQYFYTPADELTFNRVLGERVRDRYMQNPSLLGKCMAKNLVNFWILGKTWKATAANTLVQGPLVAAAFVGAWLIWKRERARPSAMLMLGILVMLLVYLVAVHAPIIAHARHSIPLVPVLAIFGSAATLQLLRTLGRVRDRSNRLLDGSLDHHRR
jgi:4-amino-4-deoxy-L-arabinose transferase-like glycosyltransferase